jgi:fimbrial chaperone protein
MARAAFAQLALLALSSQVQAAPATAMDVAPTLLQLKPGVAGLFYVTNHGAQPVTVEIEPMDWRQNPDQDPSHPRDLLSPSADLFTSPPQVTIAPGARQSVRLLATPSAPGAHAYRLLVSELPDPKADSGHVKVLLQFSVPVFVTAADPARSAPALAWSAQHGESGTLLQVTNQGGMPVKLAAAALGGALIGEGPLYVLPGARRSFLVSHPASLHVTAHDVLSGRDIDADATALP